MEIINSNVKIRYVVVDTITGDEVSKLYMFESEANAAIPDIEENDRVCGCYEKDSYTVARVETI